MEALMQETSHLEYQASGLTIRLAKNEADIIAAQKLRYRVFFEEMHAIPNEETQRTRIDSDPFDVFCDHLIVVDETRGPDDYVVGTYRMLRGSVAQKNIGFYSASEFNISQLFAYKGEILEVGRSCVDIQYRNRSTMQLLWQGIAGYVFEHNIELLFGCASLTGTDIEALKHQLSYLYHYHLAPPALRTTALQDRYVNMNMIEQSELDRRQAMFSLPPLIKGYLRVGAYVGDGAVIDPVFKTTDISIVVKRELIAEKYFKHYERTSRTQDDI